MKLRVGAATHVGRQRAANEDAYLTDHAHALFAVADGMGGHRAGEVASATAVEALQATVAGGVELDRAIESANQAVWHKALENPSMRGMGTTLTALTITDTSALIGHVGDSRAYLFRDGALTRITDDHSLVAQLVREGRLSPDEAAEHPQRSVITRALGVDEDVEVDTYEVDLHSGDRLLLCSDGLTTMIADDAITRILRGARHVQQAADQLVAAANDAGGDDNITVVVIDVDAPDEERAAAARASDAVAGADRGAATGTWEHSAGTVPAPAPQRPRPARDRTGLLRRVLVYVVPVLVVAGVAAGVLQWYGRHTYFVGLDRNRVALFKGVPGGFLVWDPTVERRSPLTAEQLTPAERDGIQGGHRFTSRRRAEAFLRRLEEAHAPTTTPTAVTPTPASTPTTAAPPSTGPPHP